MKLNKYEIITLIVSLLICNLVLVITVFRLATEDRRDVNRDGKINSKDYMIIKNYIMKNKEEF